MTLITTIGTHFNEIVIAFVILLAGLILGLLVKKILYKILQELEIDKLACKLRKNCYLERRLSNLAAYVVYLITLRYFLKQLGITSIVLYIVLGAVLLLLVVAFLRGIKDFIPNLVAGLIIHYKKYWKKGGRIKMERIEGEIERLGWSEMEIKTRSGDRIYIPNSLLLKLRKEL